MNIRNVRIEKRSILPRRKDIENKLEELLTVLPVEINSRRKLKAYVGLGKVIYVEPIEQNSLSKKNIKLGEEIELEKNYHSQEDLYFKYRNQLYFIKCK